MTKLDHATVSSQRPSKAALWTGRVISAIPVLFMGFLASYFLIFKMAMVTEGMSQYGYPANAARPIMLTQILCTLLYLIPQTAVLGAILLTGYLGGATATHVHAGEPFWFPVAFGVLVWLGLFLRDPRLRKLVPWRRLKA
jgi:hypothetical protein